jgi:hypothetical protein
MKLDLYLPIQEQPRQEETKIQEEAGLFVRRTN